MKNTGKSQPKTTLGQKKQRIQSHKILPAQTTPASEEKYRRLFETAQDGILLLDAATGVICDANPYIEELLGYSPAELIGKKLWETAPFTDVSASQAAFLKLQKKNYFRYEDLPLETKDGQRRSVDFISNVYQEGDQKVIQCNLRDITERKQMESELHASRAAERLFSERLTVLSETTTELSKAENLDELCRRAVELGRERLDFDRLSIFFLEDSDTILGTFGVDTEGRITDERGDRHPAPTDSNIWQVINNQIPVLLLTDVQLFLKGQEVGQGMHVYAGLWDGSTAIGFVTVDNLLRKRPFSDGDCEIIRLYASALGHLCARKRAQEEIRASQERFAKSFHSNPIATILALLPEGQMVDANQAFLDLIGYSREEVIGKTSLEGGYWKDPDAHRRLGDALLAREPVREVEGEFLTKSGEPRHIRASAETIMIAGQPHALIMLIDITERKRAEEELAEVKTTLEAAFEQTPVPMVMVSMPDGVIRIVNNVCREFLGMTDEPAPVGQRLADLNPSYQDYDDLGNLTPWAEAPLARALTGQRTLNQERRIVTKDGITRWALVSANPIYNANGNLIAAYLIMPDITDRKQAGDALRESENLLRESQVSAGLGSYVLDIPGGLWKSSDMLDQLFGIDAAYDRSVDGWAALTHPDDQAMMVDYFNNEVVGQGKPFDKEYRVIRHNDQAERWVHGLGKLEIDAQGQPVKMHGTIQDITGRKQAEEALARERNLLRALIDNVPDFIYVKDIEGRNILANLASAHRTGLSTPEEMLGTTDYDFFPPELADRYTADDRKVLESGQPLLGHEEPTLDGAGNPKWISTNKVPLRDGQEKIYGLVGMGRDITERKQADEELARERNLLRSLIDNAPDPIYVKDNGSRIILANLACAHLMGRSTPEQVLGKTDFDFFPPELASRYFADEKELFRSGQPLLQHEEPSADPDGNPTWFSTNKVPLRDGQGKIYGLVGMGRDITDRKQSEEQLANQAEELRRRNTELARLYHASGSLISGASLSLQELAQKIVEVVQQEFGQANCSLLAVSRESKELLRLAAVGPYTGQVKYKRLTLDGPGLVPQSIRTGAALNVGDVRSRTDYVSNWAAAQSELAIPLKIGNNVIGVIDVQSSDPQAFSPDDERLMSIFAERAALVLEHARLNTQTETHMQQLLALRTIDMAISSSFDLSMTLSVLIDQITRLLGIHAVDILAFNASTQTFKFACERGFRNHALQHVQIKFGAGYAWSLVRERQMIVVTDLREEADGLQRTPDLSGEQFVTYVGIPLLAKGQVKGVLEIFQREPLVLATEGYAFLEMLAGQAAIAIDNSELFERLQSSNAELGMAYDSTLEGWANALELRDKETEGHTRRVAELSTRLAQTMGVRDNDILQVYRGALLHDIGKMGVPDSVVLKPGPLSEDEWVIMRKHPQYAYDMLSPIAFLRQALDIPYCHHEKFDGTGYPRGLRGAQIPMAARIFAVVDVWDAITSDRPYRKAWQKEVGIQYIQEQSGRHFDPQVVKAFLSTSFTRE